MARRRPSAPADPVRRRVVTLLTDYGPGSEHVGALHAVIAAAAPGADRIDLAHDVPPGDVRWGAILLARLAPLLPGAIHLAVVDPGVGGPRGATALALPGGGALVGPDNGLLGLAARALGATAAVTLTPPAGAPATFHGRDLFAPAAARLARGEPLAVLGPARGLAVRGAPIPTARAVPGRLDAEVAGGDRFGNVALFADGDDLARAGLAPGAPARVEARSGRHGALIARIFADAAPGGLLVHVDSHGMLALAVNGGDARRLLDAATGSYVTIRPFLPGGAG